ncbi:MAG: pyridoxal phosphate-dependent aminotransferase, partial [Bacillota bacterium]|nr:pyridoxal phosphate-dependent aminotransferase [Bacillota bacterium]
MKLSSRIQAMQESPIRKLVPIAERAKQNGKKVYHLNIGQPDIETPDVFLKAIKSFDEKVIKYSQSPGDAKLIEALRHYYAKMGAEYEQDEILIMNGGSEAILFSLIAVADEGDEILVPEPFYTNYNGFSIPVGVHITPITTHAADGFRLPNYETMKSLITPKSRAILLSNPGNPTGAVYSKEEIQTLSRLAKEHDLFIIADEVYREFVYDGLEYTSFATQKEIADRVVIVDSISKRYSACGARIGSVASKNKEFIKGVLKLCMGRLCVPTLEQIGATELYKVDNSYFKAVNDEYTKRRDIVYHALKEMPG